MFLAPPPSLYSLRNSDCDRWDRRLIELWQMRTWGFQLDISVKGCLSPLPPLRPFLGKNKQTEWSIVPCFKVLLMFPPRLHLHQRGR